MKASVVRKNWELGVARVEEAIGGGDCRGKGRARGGLAWIQVEASQ